MRVIRAIFFKKLGYFFNLSTFKIEVVIFSLGGTSITCFTNHNGAAPMIMPERIFVLTIYC